MESHVNSSEWTLEVVLETPGIHLWGGRSWRGEGGSQGGARAAWAAGWDTCGARGNSSFLRSIKIFQYIWRNSIDIQIYIALSRCKTIPLWLDSESRAFSYSYLSQLTTQLPLIAVHSTFDLPFYSCTHVWAYLAQDTAGLCAVPLTIYKILIK